MVLLGNLEEAMSRLEEAITGRYTCESANSDQSLGCGETIGLAALRQGDIVVDLGCGSGKDAVAAAYVVGEEGHVIGVDMTEAMLEKARARQREAGLANVSFRLGTVEDLPVESETVDVVLSNCVINHVSDKAGAYREISRVLKPGGRFVIADVASRYQLPPEVTGDPQAWADCYGGAIPEEEYLAVIAAAGLREIKVLKRREYEKNGFPMISLTIEGKKP